MALYFPSELQEFLAAGCPALLLSVDEQGYPHTAFTWARIRDDGRLYFAVDVGSGTQRNLNATANAAIQIIGPGNLVYLVKGKAACMNPLMSIAELKLALFELQAEQVKNQAWPGTVVAPFSYQWCGPRSESMRALEAAVFEELRIAKAE